MKDAPTVPPTAANIFCAFCEKRACFIRFKIAVCYEHRDRQPIELSEKPIRHCDKHPRAVWHDSAECPGCLAEKEFIALTDKED
jgi:hypothetical protein